MKKKISEQPWFNYTVAACIAVILYVMLTNSEPIKAGWRTFSGYFSPVILGCVIAYLVNPLAKFFQKTLFRWIRKDKIKRLVSEVLAFIVIIGFIIFLLLLIVPQLIDSVRAFTANLDGYVRSLTAMMDRVGVSASMLNLDEMIDSSETLIQAVTNFVKKNLNTILSTSVNVGRTLIQAAIAFMLSMYLLADKQRLKTGGKRLLKGLIGTEKYAKVMKFLRKSHAILNRYIVFNLIDSLIIGVANLIFMAICGMPYKGLVSFVVAVTNLIPTFGPIIGAVVGGFVLLLVNPWHALFFLIFTLVLQGVDAYVIKPKLFGDSLGVSGLWILIGVIVGGRMFGVVGILLAIPGVAILDLLYRDYFMPWLEKRRKEKDAPPEENVTEEQDEESEQIEQTGESVPEEPPMESEPEELPAENMPEQPELS